MELDEKLFEESTNIYNRENLYILQYPKRLYEQEAQVSYGILKGIEDEKRIIHCCSTDHQAHQY